MRKDVIYSASWRTARYLNRAGELMTWGMRTRGWNTLKKGRPLLRSGEWNENVCTYIFNSVSISIGLWFKTVASNRTLSSYTAPSPPPLAAARAHTCVTGGDDIHRSSDRWQRDSFLYAIILFRFFSFRYNLFFYYFPSLFLYLHLIFTYLFILRSPLFNLRRRARLLCTQWNAPRWTSRTGPGSRSRTRTRTA